MKILNVRELRSAIPHLRETLAQEQELLLVSNGEAVARILPMARKRDVPSLAAHRALMAPLAAGTLENLIRQERDQG